LGEVTRYDKFHDFSIEAPSTASACAHWQCAIVEEELSIVCRGFGGFHWIQGLTRIVLCVTPPPPSPGIERKNINTNTKNLYEIFIRCVLIKELSASTLDFLGLVVDG